MNAINHAASKIRDCAEQSFELLSYPVKWISRAVEKTDSLEKVVKIAERIISIAEVVMGTISVAYSNLGKQLKDTIIVFETLKFIGAISTLISPTKNGESFFTAKENTWQKIVDRVSLAIHSFFKMLKGLNRFGFFEYGIMAKNAIGKLPIFTLVMDSFMISSSFFSAWDTFVNKEKGLPKARKDQNEAKEKLEKWEYRPTAIDLLKIEDAFVCKEFETRYKARESKLKQELAENEKNNRLNEDKLQKVLDMQNKGETTLPKESQEKILAEYKITAEKLTAQKTAIDNKMVKVGRRMEMIAKGEFKELAADLEKVDLSYRKEKWNVKKLNGEKEEIKAWSSVANAVAKIAVILFAFTLTALNLWATPFLLSLLVMGIIVDSIGLTKILLAEFLTPEKVPVQVSALA